MTPRGYNIRVKFHEHKEFWYWFGASALVLLLIISFIVVPSFSNAPASTEPTHVTTKTEAHTVDGYTSQSNDNTEDEKTVETTNTVETEPAPTPQESTTPVLTPEPTPEPAPVQSPTTYDATPTCHHEEAGRCWDDLEDEAYSAGAYDHEYGYYGASLDYTDDCDALCRDILEDAYDEGWYDAR